MTVQAKSEYLVTLLPGDGIGPEIVAATIPVLNAVGDKLKFKLKYQEADIGGIAIDRHSDPFPPSTYEMYIKKFNLSIFKNYIINKKNICIEKKG